MSNSPSSLAKGSTHWKYQRLTAILLIPMSIWFLLDLLHHIHVDYQEALLWLAHPKNGILLSLLMGLIFYHGALGLQVVIEDYVPNPFWQKVSIGMVKLISFILAVLSWFFIIQIAMTANG